MLEKKEMRTILFYDFKLGRKATETARNINNVFGQHTTNLRTVQRWFSKFRSGNERLEDK